MSREFLWVFLLVTIASHMVDGQYTLDYESTDDDLDLGDDDEGGEEDGNGDGDYNDVFDDYFDDEMRVVDVDQDVAIKGCVSNSDALVKKIDAAYDKCFKDFEDWSEFHENNDGNDKDKDGLSDEYEADEACFYKKMGWVVNSKADKEAIKNDFKNLNSKSIQEEFVSSIDDCSGWNGNFKGRKKRDAEEDSWALSFARERREAKRNNENGSKNGNNKDGKPGKGNKNKTGKGGKGKNKRGRINGRGRNRNKNVGGGKGKGGNGRRGKGKGKGVNRKRGKGKGKGGNGRRDKGKGKGGNGKRGNGKGKGKGGNVRSGKGNDKGGKGKDKGGKKKEGKGKNSSKNALTKSERKTINALLPENVYNQLWCYELSVEKALENCVEEKLLQ